jgi:hypothetical protein
VKRGDGVVVVVPGRFEPDGEATAGHDDGLPEEFQLARHGKALVTVLMIPTIRHAGDPGGRNRPDEVDGSCTPVRYLTVNVTVALLVSAPDTPMKVKV